MIIETLRQGFEEAGYDFKIWYRTDTACSCAYISDPYYGSLTGYNCATCDGSGRVWTSTPFSVRGSLNQFSRGMAYVEDGAYRFGIAPVSQARADFVLDDVLVNCASVYGRTLFTNCHTVEANGYKYKPQNQTRINYNGEYILKVVFDKISA